MSETDWSEVDMTELLPTGTVTLLLADVEGSTRLWEAQPQEMTAAVGRLDCTVPEIVGAHHGVRPVEQGEGDSFVAAFAGYRRGGMCSRVAARAACPDPAPHRCAHR
jgi:class 3 adenylate cyclase